MSFQPWLDKGPWVALHNAIEMAAPGADCSEDDFDVQEFILDPLRRGVLIASLIDEETGWATPIGPHHWISARVADTIRTGFALVRVSQNPPVDVPGAVFLPRDALISQLPAATCVTPKDERPVAAAGLPDLNGGGYRAGGRPPRWDWPGAMIELHRLDNDEGTLNKLPAELERHLAQWFADQNDGEAPSSSQLRSYVKRFREAGA